MERRPFLPAARRRNGLRSRPAAANYLAFVELTPIRILLRGYESAPALILPKNRQNGGRDCREIQ
jgi:hypothetical protein